MTELEKIWFLHDSTERAGPMTIDEVTDRLLASSSAQLHAWRSGMHEWLPAKDIEELQSALAGKLNPPRRQEPEIAMPLIDPEPSIKLESITHEKTPQEIHTDKTLYSSKKRTSPFKAPLVWSAVILGAGGGAYFLWPQLTSPQGIVNRWMTRLPEVPDLSNEQKNLLQAAASSGSADPASAPVEMVMITASSANQVPVFYLASNLPDGAELTVELKPDLATLAGNISGMAHGTAIISHRLAHTDPVHTGDGNVLPRGEYQVTVTDPDHHVRVSKHWFIGGEKDAKFNEQLAQYQQSVLTQAQAEISDLNNMSIKLAAIKNGELALPKTLKKTRTLSAQEKAKADWEKQRLALVDEIQKLLQPPVHYFPLSRNSALALQDAIEDWRTHRGAADFNAEDALKKIDAMQADLASRLDAAAKRIQTTTGYFSPET